jgi:hypothetical protein
MENKYYTPVIEEFHVGMTVQIYDQSTTKMISKVEWHDVVITPNENDYGRKVGFNRLPKLIANNKVRVKCLNKEDISSFGWVFYQYSKSTWFEREAILNIEGHVFHKITLEYDFSDNKIRICAFRNNDEIYIDIFIGVIKNKSEFKRLLKQLGIL